MGEMTPVPLAYVSVQESAFAFSVDGRVEFAARPGGEARRREYLFIVDIYVADDHIHPGGHAGWWECRLSGQETVAVSLARAGGTLEVYFDGTRPENFWVNPEFNLEGRELVLHLVVRAFNSNAIMFNDALPLFPEAAALESHRPHPFQEHVPEGLPPRWFVWPPSARVLLVFDSLRSAGAATFCAQLSSLLAANDIPHGIYARNYTPAQRRRLEPAHYLLHTAARADIAFCVFAGGGFLFPLMAGLPCKKILYHRHLPDYRRFQAFDAEFARELAEAADSVERLTAFDGLCYESEHTRRRVGAWFKAVFNEGLAQAWQNAETSPGYASLGYASPGPDGQRLEPAAMLAVHPPAYASETLFCSLPEGVQPWLPRHLRLTRTAPALPPDLGVFPPSLWARRWEGTAEEECRVPETFILSVGSFRPDKHHEDVLRIFAAVVEQHPSIGLVIAGWPSVNGYWDYLRYLRESVYAALASRIIFLQSCTDGQLLFLYRRATLFLSASSYEGYSGSLEEALEFKLPVVARRTMAGREALGFAGLQYDASVPSEAVAADILKISAGRPSFPADRTAGGGRDFSPARAVLDALHQVAVGKLKF